MIGISKLTADFVIPIPAFVAFKEGLDFEVEKSAADEHTDYVQVDVAV